MNKGWRIWPSGKARSNDVPPGKIFVSYRRQEDAGNAGRLCDRLKYVFTPERIFMDVDGIRSGDDFKRIIEQEVAKCDVLLAVIGRGWADSRDENNARKLDSTEDFVRLEIDAAIRQEKFITPVLVQDARMPRSDELPEPIRPLAKLQYVQLRHDRYDDDIAKLIHDLHIVLARSAAARETEEKLSQLRRELMDRDRQAAWRPPAQTSAARPRRTDEVPANAPVTAPEVERASDRPAAIAEFDSPSGSSTRGRRFGAPQVLAFIGVFIAAAVIAWIAIRVTDGGRSQTATKTTGGEQEQATVTEPVGPPRQLTPAVTKEQSSAPGIPRPPQEIPRDQASAANSQQGIPDGRCPSPSSGSYSQVMLDGGFEPDPHVRRIEPGGRQTLVECSPTLRGWVAARADVMLTYQPSRYPLTFNLRSNIRTVLYVIDPTGAWRYDNGARRGTPSLTYEQPREGRYFIWVGTLEETRPGQISTLEITERER